MASALLLSAYYKKAKCNGGRAAQTHAEGRARKGRSTDARPWKYLLDASARSRDADRAAIRGTYLGKAVSRVQGPEARVQERRGGAARRGREAATGAMSKVACTKRGWEVYIGLAAALAFT